MSTITEIKRTIKEYKLYDWLKDFPWKTGYIGNPKSAIWFIGENPNLESMKKIDKQFKIKTSNMQWNNSPGDKLLREAITEAGLKIGMPNKNRGWNCYITNVIKEPEIVSERNRKKQNSRYWKLQAGIWMPILQYEIDHGNPHILIAMGSQVMMILNYMKKLGLDCPIIKSIPHYSYIMSYPERNSNRGPGHPQRMNDFKNKIARITQIHGD